MALDDVHPFTEEAGAKADDWSARAVGIAEAAGERSSAPGDADSEIPF